MNILAEIITLFLAVLSLFGWGYLQKRRADKLESKPSEEKINARLEATKHEVETLDLDALVAATNEMYPGDGSDPKSE